MSIPKPKPPVQKPEDTIKKQEAPVKKAVKKPVVKDENKKLEPKKPFVLKPHLTDKPFRGNQELLQLKKRLSKPKFQNR